MRRLWLIAVLCLGWCAALGAEPQDSTCILQQFADTSSTIIVTVPEGLLPRLLPQAEEAEAKTTAKTATDRQASRQWRIQVFSDNNKRTARGGAERRQRLIQQRLPQLPARVSYNAPYWKVFVGPFRTEADARAALQKLHTAFPSLSREIRLVR